MEMESIAALKAKYDIKDMELNALLEITQAINNNLPEDDLYKIYNFTLLANLNIKKLALYVLDDEWNCKVNYGTIENFKKLSLPEAMLKIEAITPLNQLDLDGIEPFREFEISIPIAHKNRKLALVLVDGNASPEHGAINTNFIQALSNIIIVAIENKKLVRRQLEQEMIRRELAIAGNVQKFLFPKNLPNNATIKAAAFYQPHHSIGGDYYDLIEVGDRKFIFCIADVSGKGIPAALLMSNFQASLRTLLRKTIDLAEIVYELNRQIMNNAEGHHFITFFMGYFDCDANRLQYVNSGHIPPILIPKDGVGELLEKGSTVLGAFDKLPFLNIGVLEDLPDFLICTFTDGLTEISNEDGEEYGMERVYDLLANNPMLDPEEINEKIIGDLKTFKGNNSYMDDITIFTCSIHSS